VNAAVKAELVAELKAKGKEFLDAEQYNDAYATLKRASGLVKDDYDVAWGMAQASASLRNDVEALDWVDMALRAKPDSADAMELRGRLYLRMGRTDDGIATLRRTVKEHPEHTLAWLNLSAAYRVGGDRQKALEAAKAASNSDPKDATPHLAMGDLYAEGQQFDAAEKQYRLAMQKNPKEAWAYLRLVDIYIRQKKNLDQARKWALQADQLEAGDGTAASAAAWVLFLQGEKAEAVTEMAKAAEDHPQNYHIWMRLGVILEDMGEKEKAQKAYKTAAQFAPRARVKRNDSQKGPGQ